MSVHHCFVSFIGIKLFILLFHADIAVDYLHAYTEIVFEFEKVSVAYFLFVHYPLTTGGALYLSKQSQHNHTDSIVHSSVGKLDDYSLQRATKQTMIFNPPAVLTVHLKRFEQVFITTLYK